jgi:hypothetical protein
MTYSCEAQDAIRPDTHVVQAIFALKVDLDTFRKCKDRNIAVPEELPERLQWCVARIEGEISIWGTDAIDKRLVEVVLATPDWTDVDKMLSSYHKLFDAV